MPRGSWLLAEEQMERGDSAFVDELRRISDADKLGNFAARWFADSRPQARRLLGEYLDKPLNAFRHEALVKRLFKAAEKAGDDEVLGWFLVAFDRSISRVRKKRYRWDWNTRESWTEEVIVSPRSSTLTRDPKAFVYRNPRTGERMAAATPEKQDQLRLFSVHTRHHLRRRVWRHFRKLGQEHPERYLPAVVAVLKRYIDADLHDGLALLDKWSLVHILFRGCPALVPQASGWKLAPGHTLAELAAAPTQEAMWSRSPAPLLDLLKAAQSRPVRRWAIEMLRKHHASAVASLPLAELLTLIGHDDPDVAQLAAEALRQSPGLGSLPVDQWLKLIEAANPQTLELLCELMVQRLDAGSVNLEQAVNLACSRPLPVARLGLTWLKAKQPASVADCRRLLVLSEAEAESVRAEAIRWLREALGSSPHFQANWILELLDCRHDNVRREAWAWFLGEPRGRNEVALWQRLLESPYDDIRLPLVAFLEAGAKRAEIANVDRSKFEPELVRLLWATVLLNIHRGGRTKPQVVAQIVARLQRQPAEAPQLLPILSVALHSVRGPEFRAGLAGVVGLLEKSPELTDAVNGAFPELQVY